MLGVLFLMMMMRNWFLLGLLLSSFDDMPEQVLQMFLTLRIFIVEIEVFIFIRVYSLLN